jgi:anti-sigma28 factor (negative regulator of flagellin synthesis)
MTRARLAEKRTDPFGVAAIQAASNRSLPTEIKKETEHSSREMRISELKRQYQSGTYYVPAAEISAALIEKHLKR